MLDIFDAPPVIQTCQWIFGDPPLHVYCGDPCRPGKSYCPYHDRQAHRSGHDLDPATQRLIDEVCR